MAPRVLLLAPPLLLLLAPLLLAPPAAAQPAAPTDSITECNITVTSISDWPVGACGVRTSSDPRVFGPYAWVTFHRFARNYPTQPNRETRDACVAFVNAIPFMLPCAHCGEDFQEFIRNNIKYDGTYNPACAASRELDMPCRSPQGACLSRTPLVKFFLRAHHNVDVHTKPCKQLWTLEQADVAFNQSDICATGIVWGTYPICKTVGQTNCMKNGIVIPAGMSFLG